MEAPLPPADCIADLLNSWYSGEASTNTLKNADAAFAFLVDAFKGFQVIAKDACYDLPDGAVIFDSEAGRWQVEYAMATCDLCGGVTEVADDPMESGCCEECCFAHVGGLQ